ncbi:uncharacterized protein LOC133930634 [Phragmites australis]|uniref:uncharacterized protein LOC133930634 n=1 Tax=Phragmites australis TaxID=29695 RepID=UPI002D778EE3|nr:uncharacterized protein LOC133930634 [Phragmites australis]
MADRGEAAVVPGDRDRLRNLFLDAARVLMLYGTAVAVATLGSPGATATQAFVGLLLWLLGVCFLALVPAVGRFPRVALVPAAMANAVLKHSFTLWN